MSYSCHIHDTCTRHCTYVYILTRILLCAHNAHIWDKKSRPTNAIPSRRASIAHGYLSDPKNVAGYAPMGASTKRSVKTCNAYMHFSSS